MKRNILNKNWDILIILDACRHDYFKNVYKNYFEGKLEKHISPASNTIEWCKKVFINKKDNIIYISPNPYINSKIKIKGFDAKRHFYKVIDVWDFGWDKKLGTVHPKEVNKAAIKALSDFSKKRFIIHYMQPHFPYITEGGFDGWSDIINRNKRINWNLTGIKMSLGDIIKRNIKRKNIWKVKKIFGLRYKHPMEKLIQEGGERKLKEVYKKELEFVMSYVQQLLSKIKDKKIVITSDHGELLGEYGEYGHHPNMHVNKLVEVPWFEVKK